jgi:hypothetical protein
MSKFESLSVDVLFEIFSYLSPIKLLQAFLSSNKRFSTIVMHQYLWHIDMSGNRMSLSMFSDLCQNVLITSAIRYHQMVVLQCLHRIDTKSHDLKKLLRSCLI